MLLGWKFTQVTSKTIFNDISFFSDKKGRKVECNQFRLKLVLIMGKCLDKVTRMLCYKNTVDHKRRNKSVHNPIKLIILLKLQKNKLAGFIMIQILVCNTNVLDYYKSSITFKKVL